MANNSGTKLISSKWLASTGSWYAIKWANLAKYSLITAELSFKKKLCRYFGINAEKQANALAGNKEKYWLALLEYSQQVRANIFTFVIEIQIQEWCAKRIQALPVHVLFTADHPCF